jgi:phosphoglycerate dehydrogenase-like enzyme
MKKNSYIINTARGEIINETHLIKALKKKWIAGAGLDVFEKEPPSPNNPSIENEECCVIAPYRQCYIFN